MAAATVAPAAQGTAEAPPAPPPRLAPRPEASPEGHVHEPDQPGEIDVHHAFQASGHGPLLVLSNKTIVEIGARDVTVMKCDWMFRRPAGAAATPAGLRVVEENGWVVEVGPGVPCRLAAMGTINPFDR